MLLSKALAQTVRAEALCPRFRGLRQYRKIGTPAARGTSRHAAGESLAALRAGLLAAHGKSLRRNQ
jgi:hypothetical protein